MSSGLNSCSNPAPVPCSGAGEMKGISMEDNKKQLAALKKLQEQPGNRSCADCSGRRRGLARHLGLHQHRRLHLHALRRCPALPL